MRVENQFGPASEYTRSLESFYVSSVVRESRVENRSAVFLNVAIVAIMLALIGLSGFSDHIPLPWVGHSAAQTR
jgi:hypothetical protein